VKTVQARSGHGSAKTTRDTYGHVWPNRDESTRAVAEVPGRNRGGTRALGPRFRPCSAIVNRSAVVVELELLV
jgi:hypothetical protein